MSQGFGVDTYGIPFYGPEQAVNNSITPSVNPFTATQADYGEITLSWTAPLNTPWKYMQLVRSTYGYPSTAQDGVLLQQFLPGTMQKTYDDAGLTPGVIYYYTMFVTLEAPTWSNAVTYAQNAQVLFNGQYWTSLQNSNTNHSPVAGGSFWAATAYVPTWLPAGYAGTLALANDGYGTTLYTRAPNPYKTNTSDIFPNSVTDNPSLQNYFNVMGFGLDQLKNRYDSLLQVNNPDVVSATSLDILGQQLGINTDYMSSPQDRRQRIKNATVDYQMKGEPQSIHNLVAQLTGWSSVVSEGTNLQPNADASAFIHPMNVAWNANTTYFPNQLVQFNGFNYKNLVQSVGNAQAPTGASSSNTWWQVQNSIINTTTLLNPLTGGQSVWNVSTGSGVGLTLNGILTGIPHPTNIAINNWNALDFVQNSGFGTGLIDIVNVAPWTTPNWSNATNYSITAVVLYTDGYYYQALKPSGPGTVYGFITPGTNNSFWKAIYFTTSDLPNNTRDTAPIPELPTWNATTQYAVGQNVQYNGIQYQAALSNINSTPSGFYYNTAQWTFVQPVQLALVNSAYFNRVSNNGSSILINIIPTFYDITGSVINNYSSHYSNYQIGLGMTARFVNDFTDLNGTTEPSIANASQTFLGSSTWASTPSTANLWRTSYGMASADQTIAGTTTYVYSLINNASAEGRFAVTFGSDFVDTAHKTHGIVFAWNDANNFWYATRQSLRKVVAGVDTQLLSWTRLNTGDRLVVDCAPGVAVDVYSYARDGKGTLNLLGSVTTNLPTGSTSTNAGIIQKYSATGAL